MPSSRVLPIDDANFQREVLEGDAPFLLDFTAVWCGPCKVLAPILEKIAGDHAATLRVGKLDIDDSPETAKRFGIRGAPTLVLFRGGKEVARQVGVASEKRLLDALGLAP